MTAPAEEVSFLNAYLEPLSAYLARTDVSDILVNRPGEVWIETLGGSLERHEIAALDEPALWRLARQIASFSHQGISRQHPILSAALPDGSRVQIIAPPATRGSVAMAFRKHAVTDMTLSEYVAASPSLPAREPIDTSGSGQRSRNEKGAFTGDIDQILTAAVKARRNIVISGGTSTGKTTFLNALLKKVSDQERLILIEDTPELVAPKPNWVGLIAVKGGHGEASVTVTDLLEASLRMRPDRIIVGEIRGPEAYAFLRAVNSGHPGSITTLHADSPVGALNQLALMTLQGGGTLTFEDVITYARSVVDIIVQLQRREGRRVVSGIIDLRAEGALG